MESEKLSSLMRLSVSDGQKTDRSKDVSFIGISCSTQQRFVLLINIKMPTTIVGFLILIGRITSTSEWFK